MDLELSGLRWVGTVHQTNLRGVQTDMCAAIDRSLAARRAMPRCPTPRPWLQAGFILPCSTMPRSDLVVEIRWVLWAERGCGGRMRQPQVVAVAGRDNGGKGCSVWLSAGTCSHGEDDTGCCAAAMTGACTPSRRGSTPPGHEAGAAPEGGWSPTPPPHRR